MPSSNLTLKAEAWPENSKENKKGESSTKEPSQSLRVSKLI